jgi:myo-inositol 2-dehydrogenase/D-chiro-inositol 1-dehydrogenase
VVDFRERFISAYRAEIDAFLALARGDGSNPCNLDEALRTQRLVEAARTALRESRVVGLGDVPTGPEAPAGVMRTTR